MVRVATPQTGKARSRRKSKRRHAPFLVTLLVAGLAASAWLLFDSYRHNHVTLMFANGEQPVPPLELTFFPEQLAFGSPSPPPPLGEQHVGEQASVVVGEELVPGHGVVRYRGEGVGAGFAYVRLGKAQPTIQLRPPRSLSGRIGEPIGYWLMGWRCAGVRAVANAEVFIMGGGEHGIDLASTKTDAEGRFTIEGFDGELDALGLRVRAPGYVIVHQHLDGLAEHADERAMIALTPATPRRGRLQLGVDLAPASLRLLARGLPGVDTVPAADGTFVLDHIPDDLEARIVVHGLPEDCAQFAARTSRAQEVVVAIVQGAVVQGQVLDYQLQGVAGALVWIGENPAIRTDAHGRYRLTHVLPGTVTVTAQLQTGRGSRARSILGERTVQVEPNGKHVDIDISLNR